MSSRPSGEPQIVCNHAFESTEALHKHLKSTHIQHLHIPPGTRDFFCCWEGCTKSELTRGHLHRHTQAHSNYAPHSCDLCSCTFKTADQLKAHKASNVHNGGNKNFVCPHPGCGKAFALKDALKTHQRTHTKEKPYVCQTCGTAFPDSSNRTKHRKARHESAAAVPCPFYPTCGYRDSLKSGMEKHCRAHGHSVDTIASPAKWKEWCDLHKSFNAGAGIGMGADPRASTPARGKRKKSGASVDSQLPTPSTDGSGSVSRMQSMGPPPTPMMPMGIQDMNLIGQDGQGFFANPFL